MFFGRKDRGGAQTGPEGERSFRAGEDGREKEI